MYKKILINDLKLQIGKIIVIDRNPDTFEGRVIDWAETISNNDLILDKIIALTPRSIVYGTKVEDQNKYRELHNCLGPDSATNLKYQLAHLTFTEALQYRVAVVYPYQRFEIADWENNCHRSKSGYL